MTTNQERIYEGMFLLDAREARREGSDLEARVHELLEKNGARIDKAGRWEERKLAYEVGGQKRALYYLAYFHAATEAIPELRREAALVPGLLRVLFLRVESIPSDDFFKRRESGEGAEAAPREGSASRPRGDEGGTAGRDAAAAPKTTGDGAETVSAGAPPASDGASAGGRS